MTQNQIKYLELQESKRSNLEKERQGRETISESQRHNRSVEGETNRHNLITENQYMLSLVETSRSNRANEDIARERNSISREANLINDRHYTRSDANAAYATYVQDQHYQRSDAETARSNRAKESELNRHNLRSELIDAQNAETAAYGNSINAWRAQQDVRIRDQQNINTWLGTQSSQTSANAQKKQAATSAAKAESDITRNTWQNWTSLADVVLDGLELAGKWLIP